MRKFAARRDMPVRAQCDWLWLGVNGVFTGELLTFAIVAAAKSRDPIAAFGGAQG